MEHEARKFVKDFKLQSKDGEEGKIVELVAKHLDALVFNVVSLAAVVVMLYDERKIEPKHLVSVRAYIASKCDSKRSMSGGTSMASDFYGYDHPAYNVKHAGDGVVVSQVDWSREIRPAMGPTIGGGSAASVMQGSKNARKTINHTFKHYHTKVSKTAMKELLDILDHHLVCFAHDLKSEGTLTVKKVEKVLKLKRHSVFV
jgi:hypothetical protein